MANQMASSRCDVKFGGWHWRGGQRGGRFPEGRAKAGLDDSGKKFHIIVGQSFYMVGKRASLAFQRAHSQADWTNIQGVENGQSEDELEV